MYGSTWLKTSRFLALWYFNVISLSELKNEEFTPLLMKGELFKQVFKLTVKRQFLVAFLSTVVCVETTCRIRIQLKKNS